MRPADVAQAVNFTLYVVTWLLIGRFILVLLFGRRPNLIVDLLRRLTDPLLRLVRRLMPGFVPDRYIPLLTLVLIVLLRVMLLPFLRMT